jgi:hypothetical protein
MVMRLIWTNYQVMDFLAKYPYKKAERSCPVDDNLDLTGKAIENNLSLEIVYLKPGGLHVDTGLKYLLLLQPDAISNKLNMTG